MNKRKKAAADASDRCIEIDVPLDARQTDVSELTCAIVGMATRLPGGSNTPQAFWDHLQQGTYQVGSLSASRFEWPEFIDTEGLHVGIDRAYLIDDVASQDMAFFGISPKEAELMDPQQRILLELSWETFESAGLRPSSLNGSTTGVFVGVCHSDYRELVASRATTAEAYVGTGNIPCMLANRVSYFYNFKGPSFTVDTACSSSLFAVAEAVNAISRGDCEQALVGAINLLLTPTSSIAYYQSGMLSSNTTCNPFDDNSDGYIRSEGAGMILVKSLEKARRDGDHVIAIVKAVAINHGGKARSLTAPNALSQAQVITKAIEKAGIDVGSVNYIETHGTGTPVGDPIEIHGITRSFGRIAKQQGVSLPSNHCALGALKSAIGHSEAAAGMAAMIKVMLSMQHRRLPPNPRLGTVNRRIELDETPFFLVREGMPWVSPVVGPEASPAPLRAGISSFGFGGTNAHLLLESSDMPRVPQPEAPDGRLLFGLSAKTQARLAVYASKYIDWLSDERIPSLRACDVSYTMMVGREPMHNRLAIVAGSLPELRASLQAFLDGTPMAGVCSGQVEAAQEAADADPRPQPDPVDLEALAAFWVTGGDADLRSLYGDDVRSLPLAPTYPFDRKSYWLPWREVRGSRSAGKASPGHPLLDQNISDFRRQAYRTVFTPNQPIVSEHHVAGHRVLPATAFVVMAQYAIADALALTSEQAISGLLTLTGLHWIRPLVVGSQPVAVELRVFPLEAKQFGFEFLDPSGRQLCYGNALLDESDAGARHVALEPVSAAVESFTADACYERYARMGLEYGPEFRIIQSILRDGTTLIAELALPLQAADDPLPATLLDGALQSSIGSELGYPDGVSGQLVMPVSIGAVRVLAPCERRMRSVIRRTDDLRRDALDAFDLDLYDLQGRVCVRFSDVRCAHPTAAQLEARISEVLNEDARAVPSTHEDGAGSDAGRNATTGVATLSLSDLRTVLIEMIAGLVKATASEIDSTRNFVDYGLDSILTVSLARQINARWKCRLSPAIAFECRNADTLATHVAGLLADAAAVHPAAAAGSAEAAVPAAGDISADALVSSLKDTVGQLVKLAPSEIDANAKFSDYGVDSIIIGSLTRAINKRWKQDLKPTLLFELNRIQALAEYLSPRVDRSLLASGAPPTAAIANDTAQVEHSARFGMPRSPTRFIAEVAPAMGSDYLAIVLNEPMQLGDIAIADAREPMLGDEDVVVAVRAFSLNFGDLLCVSGFYPDMPAYPFTPGFEASGTVAATGRSVRGIAVGDEVVVLTGEALGAHANRVQCHQERVYRKPAALSFEDACALPVVAMTVLDAFAKAKPVAGDRILIHSAAGGIGLAAVQLARHHGAEIYATAGSEEKLRYLRSQGIRHLINYREADFEQKIREMTGGQGVDIVLNTLPGDAIQKGLNSLAAGGRYVEMAMTALKSATQIDLSALGDNQAFFSVNLRKLGLKQPAKLREYFDRMVALVEQGALRATIGRLYSFDRYRDACEYLASRHSVGKVVVTIPEQMRYRTDVVEMAATGPDLQAANLRVVDLHGAMDIAIVGMSGRFADSENVEALWRHLAQGDDLVRPVTRWDLSAYHTDSDGAFCNRGSFIDDIDAFDPLFFGISGIEARYMDPQQRLLLEEAWHALEDAGYASERVNDGTCGVYVGCSEGDYHHLFGDARLPAQAFWGNALSLVPARIAYHLDLRGPAVAVDTACSSSLVAIHQACQSLWLGEVDMALAGGVFIQSTPKLYLSAERSDMLSHRGHCHTFGDQADGFVPGEGVGVVVLKRMAQALADGDHVYAVIRGSGIGQDGSSNGITAPSGSSQQRLQRDVYRKFNIDPARIQMVEAHGTGTSLGDPIEFDALTRSFGEFTDRRGFCALGSIKSNIGHLAPAAGIAGLIKILLSMQHRQIPPTLNCRPSNPYLDLDNSPFYLSESLREWSAPQDGKRLAALSSFGFSGTNAHLVLEDPALAVPPSSARPAYLVAISALSWEQVSVLAEGLIDRLRASPTDCGHLSHTLLIGRKHFNHRLACVVRDTTELADKLQAWSSGRDRSAVLTAEVVDMAVARPAALRAAGESCLDRCVGWTDATRYVDDLSTLAELYCKGYDFDYRRLSGDGTFRRLPLPTYPFARHRYWVNTHPKGVFGSSQAAMHPLVQRNLSSLAAQRYSSRFCGAESVFADHRVHGKPVLSGVAQLEMAVAAVASALDRSPEMIALSDVYWLTQLMAVEQTEVRIEVESAGNDAVSFEIVGEQGGRPVRYCEGRAHAAPPAEHAGQALDYPGIAATDALLRFDAEHCYEVYRSRGIEYGPTHRGLREVLVDPGRNRLWSSIALPEAEKDSSRYNLPPGLLDSVLQATIGFDLEETGAEGATAPLVPFALARLVRVRPLPDEIKVEIRRTPTAEGAVFDLDAYDNDGQLCLKLESLEARRFVERPASAAKVTNEDDSLLLRPRWVLSACPIAFSAVSSDETTLVIGLDGDANVRLMRAYPRSVEAGIFPGDDGTTIREKLAASPDFDHIVLAFPDAHPGAAPDARMIERHDRAIRFFFLLIQTVVSLGYDARSLNWSIITRGAQPLDRSDQIDPALASIHGMAGSMAKEYPHWQLRLLDVDDFSALPLPSLSTMPFDAMGNAWLLRRGRWFRQVLQPCSLGHAPGSAYREGGVYVIVGGAGGIGEVLSEYLIRRYRARIAWIGRRAQDGLITAKLDRLAALGTRPLYFAADASDRDELAGALASIHSMFGAVQGLIHSAIVLEDKSLANMEEDALMRALDAKVKASVCMAEVFREEPLDFVLFFSSANSYLKAPGQGNYVAGCLFQDALAQRMAQSAPYAVKVVNWGYWGTVGIVANDAVGQRIAAYGLASIDPDRAMDMLERLLAGPFDQLTYLAVNRRMTALGVAISDEDHAVVADTVDDAAPGCAIPAILQAFETLPEISTDDSRDRIEHALLPLLWHQIRQAGLVVRLLSEEDDGKRCYTIVESRHGRWLQESLNHLIAAGVLRLEGDRIRIDEANDPEEADWTHWSTLRTELREHSDSRHWFTLVDCTLHALPDILGGKRLATEVMFPDSSMELVEGIYKSDRIARIFNAGLANAVAAFAGRRAPRSVRVLEIGAGTGSASEHIFARLRADGIVLAEYCYTDISKAFLFHAQEHYGSDVDYLSYDTLDIERVGEADTPHAGLYDIVVAGNVLHATRDTAETLQNVKNLLKCGGLLLINEISENTLMMHLTFGLLDGWWLHRDSDLRLPGGPALGAEAWQRTLTGLGFTRVEMPMASLRSLGYQIIVAQSDGVIVRRGPAPARHAHPEHPIPKDVSAAQQAVGSTGKTMSASREAAGIPATVQQQAASWVSGSKADAVRQLVVYLRGMAAGILDLEIAAVDTPLKPFKDAVMGNFGMDSLLSSNMRNRLLKEIEVDIPVQVLIGERVADIVEQIYQQLLLRQVSRHQDQETEGDFETFVF